SFSEGIAKISTASNSLVATLAVTHQRGLGVSPDGSRLYAVDTLAHSISVIDAVTGHLIATVPTPASEGSYVKGSVVVTATTAYVGDLGDSGVAFLDVATNTVSHTAHAASRAGAIALSADETRLFV